MNAARRPNARRFAVGLATIQATFEVILGASFAATLGAGCARPAPDPPSLAPDTRRSSAAPAPLAADPIVVRHFDARELGAAIDHDFEFAWRDPVVSCSIESDAPREAIEDALGDTLRGQVATLREIFPEAEPSRLVIRFHSSPARTVSGVPVNAVHRDGKVDVFAGTAEGGISREIGAHLRHELVHAFLHLARRRPPRWLDEGLAQTLSNVLADSGGRLEPQPRVDFILGLATLERDGRAPTLESMLDSSRAYPDPAELGAFYVASWSFTHYALRRQEGGLRERVVALLRAQRTELLALGPGWCAEAVAGDPAAAYAELADRGDAVFDDAAEHALSALGATPGWWLAIDRFSAGEASDRQRAARLIAFAPVSARGFSLVATLLADPDPAVRRSATRAVFSNAHWVKDGPIELAHLAANPAASSAATLALALGGDVDALARWLDLDPPDGDHGSRIDALLALERVLPTSADAPAPATLLESDFDSERALARIAGFVATNRDALHFDSDAGRYAIATR